MSKSERKGQLLAALGLSNQTETSKPKSKKRKTSRRNWEHQWSMCQLQRVIDDYGRVPPGEIAAAISKSKRAVIAMAGRLGLRNKRPPWTPDELDYLESYWGTYTIPTIAKRLGKTESAVAQKAKHLGLGPTKQHPEQMTAQELAKTLNIDPHTITHYWVPKCGLPARKRITRSVQKFWRIKISDFWKWAEQNQDKFDTRRFEKGALGKEPEWMQMKRQRDKHLPGRQRKKWTEAEDARLISLFRSGVTQREIAKRLERSTSAVQHRLQRIGWERIWEEPKTMRIVSWK